MANNDAAGQDNAELAGFFRMIDEDKALFIHDPELLRWLFVDKLYARNERVDMNFYGFDGKSHLKKFFYWQKKQQAVAYIPQNLIEPLVKKSLERDMRALSDLGLSVPAQIVQSIARYNAEDYLFQRFYPVPDALRPRIVLDFGAGFGRMANLAFGASSNATQLMIAVDAIPGPYLTQRTYYRALGLKLTDYLDEGASFDFERSARASQIIHLPTWRLDTMPTHSVDLICCVQVLKELPGEVLIFVLREFARVLKGRGAIYIRDHERYHHPNQMPIDELLLAAGFVLEFRPNLRDRSEVHGLPRIWRKLDPAMYLDGVGQPHGTKAAAQAPPAFSGGS